jgi:hypothetical protein
VLHLSVGTEFLTSTSNGIKLVSNAGALLRNLAICGTSANNCDPVRWGNSTAVLADHALATQTGVAVSIPF